MKVNKSKYLIKENKSNYSFFAYPKFEILFEYYYFVTSLVETGEYFVLFETIKKMKFNNLYI